jgi:tellurite resistance protein TerC
MDPTLIMCGAFAVVVLAALALDLGVFHRTAHVVSAREALRWTAVWIAIATAMGLGILVVRGPSQAVEYATGYVIEYSLSIDNVFVFSLVFAAFAIPRELQHRVLFWGVFGALAMRLLMILIGTALIERFDSLLLVFGAFLVVTGIRMLRRPETVEAHPENNPIVRFARRRLRATSELHGQAFFVSGGAGRLATPLLLCLLVVEVSDLIFAVDSIPAIFGVTTDPFIVFTSNAAAILGLRSLYFLLADAAARFHHLSTGLAIVLLFIGLKLLAGPWLHVPPLVSLVVVVAIVAGAIVASIASAPRAAEPEAETE